MAFIQRYEAVYRLPCYVCKTWTASRTVVTPHDIRPVCCAECDAWTRLSDVEQGMCIGAAIVGWAETVKHFCYLASYQRWLEQTEG